MNTVAETESKAVRLLVESAEPTLYSDLEKYNLQHIEASNWLKEFSMSEDYDVAAKIIVHQNKLKRLTSKLEELSTIEAKLEIEALEFHRRQEESNVSNENIKYFTGLLKTIKSVSTEHQFYLSVYPIFKGQVEAELSRNEVIVNRFNDAILTASPFKIKS